MSSSIKKYNKLEMLNWIDDDNDNNSVYYNVKIFNCIYNNTYKKDTNNKIDEDNILHEFYIEIIKDLFKKLSS